VSKYNKLWVALLGGLMQIALALPSLLDSGAVPAQWVPWVRVLVAVLTAAGVYGVPNGPTLAGRHEQGTGPDPEAGRASVVLVLAVAGLVLFTVPASAQVLDPGRPATMRAALAAVGGPVVAPVVTSAELCGEVLYVHFTVLQLTGRTWASLPDAGGARLEVLEVSGRSQPGGEWETPVGVGSGGEGVLRWPGWERAAELGLHYGMARVTVDGFTSERAPIENGCAA
jgi:hypothetical protein